MGKIKEWDIEECRTKFESAEHWKLKKDFLLAHKDKFKKSKLICLSQVFVNVQLLRCRYPDPVMTQIAELSKGIGIDYKTLQKERLQRTFVKASDAAAAKVKKINLKYGETKSDGDTPLDGEIDEPQKSKKDKQKKMSDSNINEVSNSVSKEETEQSQDDCVILPDDEIEEPLKKKKKSKKLDKDEIKASDTEIFLSKMKNILLQTEKNISEETTTSEKPTKWKKIVFNENEDEIQVVNKYAKALKTKSDTCRTSFVSPKVASISIKPKGKLDYSQPKSFYEECFDPKDMYKSNIFLVKRNFSTVRDHSSLLHESLQFSKLAMNTAFIPHFGKNVKCLLTTNVRNQNLNLGEAIDGDRGCARESAIIHAVENLLKKCFTIEIKKKANSDGEISMDIINQNQNKKNQSQNQNEEKSAKGESIGSDNVGAKMLKLMGWSGGGLGKNEDGIKEPISVTTPIGRSGLGVKNEDNATPIFRNKVKEILDEMVNKIHNSVDNIVNDLVFSTELSHEQRKHIHLFTRKKYKQLATVSYGKEPNRYLVIKPKVDNQKLVRCVLSQGGSTDKYEIHKPGTLTVDYFFPQEV